MLSHWGAAPAAAPPCPPRQWGPAACCRPAAPAGPSAVPFALPTPRPQSVAAACRSWTHWQGCGGALPLRGKHPHLLATPRGKLRAWTGGGVGSEMSRRQAQQAKLEPKLLYAGSLGFSHLELVLHWFFQQTFIEHLLYARHSFRYFGVHCRSLGVEFTLGSEENRDPDLLEFIFQWDETVNKQTHRR